MNGVDIVKKEDIEHFLYDFRYKAENEKFRPSKDDFHKENKNVVEYEKNVKKQLNNKLSKLSEEQRTQIFKDETTWWL